MGDKDILSAKFSDTSIDKELANFGFEQSLKCHSCHGDL